MHQAGFKNTVGTLGTALSSSHFLQLERIGREIIFMFDGDAAENAPHGERPGLYWLI